MREFSLNTRRPSMPAKSHVQPNFLRLAGSLWTAPLLSGLYPHHTRLFPDNPSVKMVSFQSVWLHSHNRLYADRIIPPADATDAPTRSKSPRSTSIAKSAGRALPASVRGPCLPAIPVLSELIPRSWRADCSTTFNGQEYKTHTSCISEAEKYQGALYKGKKVGRT